MSISSIKRIYGVDITLPNYITSGEEKRPLSSLAQIKMQLNSNKILDNTKLLLVHFDAGNIDEMLEPSNRGTIELFGEDEAWG